MRGPSNGLVLQEVAGSPAQVVLVDQGLGVTVGEVVLAAEPADLLVEAEERGAVGDGAQPVADLAARAMGDAVEQVPVGFVGEVRLGHRRLRYVVRSPHRARMVGCWQPSGGTGKWCASHRTPR